MYGKVGRQALSSGTGGPVRLDVDGNVVVSAYGGKYADAAMAGRLFYAANQTPVATSTTLNTTFTGLALCNPSGSGKVIIVHRFGYALDQACAGESVLALATTTSSGLAAQITPQCCRYGYATSVAYVDDAATIIAPVITQIIASLGQGADSTQFMPPPTIIDLGGSIILDPGRAVVTDTTVATGATSVQFSFMWEEVDG